MILRIEWLIDKEDGSVVVLNTYEHPKLGGWPDTQTASASLRARASHYEPEPLICGGYETRKPN